MKAGQLLQLSVTPLKNHGADSTLVEWEIAEVGGKGRKWNLDGRRARRPARRQPARGPPRQQAACGGSSTPATARSRCRRRSRDISGKPGPARLAQRRHAVRVRERRQRGRDARGRSCRRGRVFVHPAPNGNVAVGWLSPIDGKVRITGRVEGRPPRRPGRRRLGARTLRRRRAEPTCSHSRSTAEKRQAVERERADAGRGGAAAGRGVRRGRGQAARREVAPPRRPGEARPGRAAPLAGGARRRSRSRRTAGSGRLELAGWIASKDNPLTARVMVEPHLAAPLRQGAGADAERLRHARRRRRRTPNCSTGSRREFVDVGLERQGACTGSIMLSATYQQASADRADAARASTRTTTCYWRFDRRRLSGRGDPRQPARGERPTRPHARRAAPVPAGSDLELHAARPVQHLLRDRQAERLPDRRCATAGTRSSACSTGPTRTPPRPQRQTTTVPTQALYFLNDPFFHAQADAARGSRGRRSRRTRHGWTELFRLAFQRTPTAKDRDAATAFLARYTAALPDNAERPKAAWAALARVAAREQRVPLPGLIHAPSFAARVRAVGGRRLAPDARHSAANCSRRTRPTRSPRRSRTSRRRRSRVIFLFMSGGVSHVDSFDPKPKLTADHGKKVDVRPPRDPQPARVREAVPEEARLEVRPARQERDRGQRPVPARRASRSTTSP